MPGAVQTGTCIKEDKQANVHGGLILQVAGTERQLVKHDAQDVHSISSCPISGWQR